MNRVMVEFPPDEADALVRLSQSRWWQRWRWRRRHRLRLACERVGRAVAIERQDGGRRDSGT